RELLQLTVTLFLAQARHQSIERPRQVPDLPAAGCGELDRQVAGRYACRSLGEVLERAGDGQTHDEGQQANAQNQPSQEKQRAGPQRSSLTQSFGTRGFRNRGPPELRYTPQHRYDLTSPGARLYDGLAFSLDELSGGRFRQGSFQQFCGVARGTDYEVPLLGDQVEFSRAVRGQLFQHVPDAIEIELRPERAHK